MITTIPRARRTVLRGVGGLRNVVCLSAVLGALGQVPGVTRVRRVSPVRGEIELEGAPSPRDVERAVAQAADLLSTLRAESPADADALGCGVLTDQLAVVELADPGQV